ncbi:MAG: alginate O-acetyltransferase AlgX-related protein [Desulfomonilaceae bacterium]
MKLLLKIAIISLVTFSLAEIGLRLCNKIFPSYIFYDNSYNRFRGKPLADDYDFRLNSRGFKDVERKKEKEPGVYRILGLGDSFAFGVVPYRFNFMTLLEKQLNQCGKAEVINMGIPWLDPEDFLSVLVHEGLEFNPDLVMVCFFIGRDFLPNERSIWTYSYAASFIKFIYDLHASYEGQIYHGKSVYEDDKPTLTNETFMHCEMGRSRIFLKNVDKFQVLFDGAIAPLRKMKEICSARGIDLLAVMIPDEMQVNSPLQSEVVTTSNRSQNQFDFALPDRMLSHELENLKVKQLDLLEPFKLASMREALYKPRDTHWNIAGNKLAAEVIGNYIRNAILTKCRGNDGR